MMWCMFSLWNGCSMHAWFRGNVAAEQPEQWPWYFVRIAVPFANSLVLITGFLRSCRRNPSLLSGVVHRSLPLPRFLPAGIRVQLLRPDVQLGTATSHQTQGERPKPAAEAALQWNTPKICNERRKALMWVCHWLPAHVETTKLPSTSCTRVGTSKADNAQRCRGVTNVSKHTKWVCW